MNNYNDNNFNNCNQNNFYSLTGWRKDSNDRPHPVRQILQSEVNNDLRWVYFDILMLDGQTPALDEGGQQPELNIAGTGWSTTDVGPLQSLGFGYYRAPITLTAVSGLGIILGRYIGTVTLESHSAPIEVIESYRQSNIFNEGEGPKLLSYVTINEAENYFSTRFRVHAWDRACDKDKLKTLCAATKDIDNLAFQGVKTSEYRWRIRQFYTPGDWMDPYYALSWVSYRPSWGLPDTCGPIQDFPENFYWDDKRAHTHRRYDNFVNDYQKYLALSPWCQLLEFPRNGSMVVPTNIKEACCEIAYQYLNGFDMELEIASLNITYQSFSNTRDGFDRRFYIEHIRSGINSARAWMLIKPYLRDPNKLRIARTS